MQRLDEPTKVQFLVQKMIQISSIDIKHSSDVILMEKGKKER